MKRTEYVSDKAAPAVGPYVHAVRHGDVIYCSGAIPLTADGVLVEGDITVQTRQVMQNLSHVLEAAGSSLQNALKCTCFLADFNDFGAFNEEYGRWFTSVKPARSTVEVSRLPRDVLVEVEVIAAAS